MKAEARKANMKQNNIWKLAEEAKQEHKRMSYENINQIRFGIQTTAQTLITRRL